MLAAGLDTVQTGATGLFSTPLSHQRRMLFNVTNVAEERVGTQKPRATREHVSNRAEGEVKTTSSGRKPLTHQRLHGNPGRRLPGEQQSESF